MTAPAGGDGARTRVLLVCTANRYRSPAAEFLLRAEAQARGLPWDVASAGVEAVPGQPLDADLARLLEPREVPTGPWLSRRLDAGLIADSDLVLPLAPEHRAAVVTLSPGALRRTFLLLQFARLLAVAAEVGVMGTPIDAVVAARGLVQPVPAALDGVPDPVGRGPDDLRQCVDRIAAAVRQLGDAAQRWSPARPADASAGDSAGG